MATGCRWRLSIERFCAAGWTFAPKPDWFRSPSFRSRCCSPWREGDWSVLLEERRAVARTGRWDGFATERDVLELLLSRAMTEAGDAKPRRLRVWGHPPPT